MNIPDVFTLYIIDISLSDVRQLINPTLSLSARIVRTVDCPLTMVKCMWAPVISLDIVKFAQRIGCLQVHIGDDSLVLTHVISLCGGGCDGGPAWFS